MARRRRAKKAQADPSDGALPPGAATPRATVVVTPPRDLVIRYHLRYTGPMVLLALLFAGLLAGQVLLYQRRPLMPLTAAPAIPQHGILPYSSPDQANKGIIVDGVHRAWWLEFGAPANSTVSGDAAFRVPALASNEHFAESVWLPARANVTVVMALAPDSGSGAGADGAGAPGASSSPGRGPPSGRASEAPACPVNLFLIPGRQAYRDWRQGLAWPDAALLLPLAASPTVHSLTHVPGAGDYFTFVAHVDPWAVAGLPCRLSASLHIQLSWTGDHPRLAPERMLTPGLTYRLPRCQLFLQSAGPHADPAVRLVGSKTLVVCLGLLCALLTLGTVVACCVMAKRRKPALQRAFRQEVIDLELARMEARPPVAHLPLPEPTSRAFTGRLKVPRHDEQHRLLEHLPRHFDFLRQCLGLVTVCKQDFRRLVDTVASFPPPRDACVDFFNSREYSQTSIIHTRIVCQLNHLAPLLRAVLVQNNLTPERARDPLRLYLFDDLPELRHRVFELSLRFALFEQLRAGKLISTSSDGDFAFWKAGALGPDKLQELHTCVGRLTDSPLDWDAAMGAIFSDTLRPPAHNADDQQTVYLHPGQLGIPSGPGAMTPVAVRLPPRPAEPPPQPGAQSSKEASFFGRGNVVSPALVTEQPVPEFAPPSYYETTSTSWTPLFSDFLPTGRREHTYFPLADPLVEHPSAPAAPSRRRFGRTRYARLFDLPDYPYAEDHHHHDSGRHFGGDPHSGMDDDDDDGDMDD
ncbi:hypothetical protein, variant [Fonticula alba]|uniref:Uncharacterized protein n=1 Tax=Fonticula alba TaxID=691883 RepID=A0A058Z0H6_FONAL|nr:hypothetical protein, variant [Fonticula alba]KCV67760.1 hypothetical protein, variant [Fonticula alba]|eukprot:XP_009497791.1 hypothetical protein, variant [Fonticula alba]